MLSRLLDEEECRMRREREQDLTGIPSAEHEAQPSPAGSDSDGNEPDA